MKKTVLVLLMTLTASAAFSKQLTVVCEKQAAPNLANGRGATLSSVMEIANVNSVPVIQEFNIQGQSASIRISDQEISKNYIQLSFQFGKQLYSSASLRLRDCGDSFSATGEAELKLYVGGFAGTTQQTLKCTCELK